ncbi:DNRLRE domain-containing protein, partial [candidate division KSB1 bacterium]|nr:DNRLRE domain-containing protein [candidate division KSB1 bacterium]NIU91222.1 DNRLRE domain-containing protein [candidate division KSB1 bacterium]NIW17718.1 DNRLRE domain-containing protein [candidate division KSB1 bacterium]
MGTLEEVTFRDTVTNTGSSPFLLLGAFRDIETRILLKFDSIPDTVEVIDATILLRTNAIVGETRDKTAFTATVHQVTSDWDESTVSFENFQDAFDPNPLASSEILSVDREPASGEDLDVEIVSFDLAPEVIESLTDSTSMFNRFGVFIDFSSDSRFIK